MDKIINNEHKEICEKYNFPYISEYSWNNYYRCAKMKNLTVEDYFKNKIENKEKFEKEHLKLKELNLKNNINKINVEKDKLQKEHKEICEKFNVPYINEYSWGNYAKLAKKNNLDVEDYLKILSKKILNENNRIDKLNNLNGSGCSIKICVKCKMEFAGQKATKYCPNCSKEIKIIEDKNRESLKNFKIKINNENYLFENFVLNERNRNYFYRKYYKKPGILFIYGYSNKDNKIYCLTGGQTSNLYRHILEFYRFSNKNKVKQCEDDNRWFEIANNYHDFEIKIIDNFDGVENRKIRDIFETVYAVKNNSLYWSPTVSQQNIIKNL